MKTIRYTYCLVALLSAGLLRSVPALAHEQDDPFLTRVLIDQLEWRSADEADPTVLEAQAWAGRDLHKVWFRSDVEHVDGETEEAELQALYSRGITPFWDLQIGARLDFRPEPTRSWGVLGVQGLAPYFYEIDAALFVGESGDVAARLSAEYELMLTQKWVLSPEVSLDFYGQNDAETGIGSGLSTMEAGLRLRYEIRREFAPYAGIHWNKAFGNTEDLVRGADESTSDTHWVLGLRAWF